MLGPAPPLSCLRERDELRGARMENAPGIPERLPEASAPLTPKTPHFATRAVTTLRTRALNRSSGGTLPTALRNRPRKTVETVVTLTPRN